MKVLINVKCIQCPGGVAQIYKILELNKSNDIDYFIASPNCNCFFKLILFVLSYFKFVFKIRKYDIIHLNPSLDRNAIWRDLVYLLLAKIFKKKVIVFMHGWDDYYASKIKNSSFLKMVFGVYNWTNAFFVLGDIFRKKLVALGIDDNKQFFIETTIADDRYISDFCLEKRIVNFNDNQTPIRFLFISRITTGKGMNLAIDIFQKIQEKHQLSMELIIAGDGDKLMATKHYVREKKVSNVIFSGYIQDEEKHDMLSKSDIMLFPTMYGEGLPNSVLEGMLYGMPIISRINAGIPDWVKNYENGFLSESTSSEEFVHFINELVKDKDLFSKIARNNHEIAKKYFVKSVVAKRFLERYEYVLKH